MLEAVRRGKEPNIVLRPHKSRMRNGKFEVEGFKAGGWTGWKVKRIYGLSEDGRFE
jgi:hypothetical protein